MQSSAFTLTPSNPFHKTLAPRKMFQNPRFDLISLTSRKSLALVPISGFFAVPNPRSPSSSSSSCTRNWISSSPLISDWGSGDFKVLHDAFFKYQTKPKLTTHGDLYHEGKEFEVKLREMKPGVLSHELKEALGMTDGAPPPWLINMQKYGSPPSYPHLKIPGLNAPIPTGASFGYHPGGWGKSPVDETGKLLKQSDKQTGHQKTIASLSKSADGSHFLSGALDKSAKVVVGGGQDAAHVTTAEPRAGKFESQFFHKILQEEIGNVKGHFGSLNALAFNPRWEKGNNVQVEFSEVAKVADPTDAHLVSRAFPRTYEQPLIHFLRSSRSPKAQVRKELPAIR